MPVLPALPMPPRASGRSVAVVLAAALAVPALSGCQVFERHEAKKNAGKECGSELTSKPAQALPGDFPGLPGATTYRSDAQGKTRVWFAYADGGLDDIATTRDKVDQALQAAGYTIKGTDEEKRIEAESEFTGPHEGTLQVQALCNGKLRLRYKLTS